MGWYNENIKTNPVYTSIARVRALDILYPPFLFSLVKLFVTAHSEGLHVSIFETYRSQERQLDLFNKGATQLMRNGMHHFGVAADIVFLDGGGNPSWSVNHNWARMGKIGQDFGLEWGGSWGGFIDKPHFQLIPATVNAQSQIVAENYPPYAPSINTKRPELLQLYNQAKTSGFSAVHIAGMLAFVSGPIAPPPPAPLPPVFIRTLKKGMDGSDVLLLQKVLNADVATRIASQGPGSLGHETDHFGSLTEKAVQKFQIKYGIASPMNPAYGTAGPKTRAKLQELATVLHL